MNITEMHQIDAIIASNPKQVEEAKLGKEKAFNALVGMAMKITKGHVNSGQVTAVIRQKISGCNLNV